ncbi:MAG: cation-translocating P-type ATPase C-terminal domain-containing protein [Cyanobium sp. CZS 48M]|nr:cation-translocating P-type ATPase C-terminal domain-containing protein [Cyanobium sp. CZS48M]
MHRSVAACPLALALEPGKAGLMERQPARPGETIFARGIGRSILRVGMVFTTLCLAQMGHALSARSDRPLIQVSPFSNPWLLWAVGLTSALQLLLLYVPVLARFFDTEPLSAVNLLICVGVSLVFFVVLETDKLVRLWWRGATTDSPAVRG